MQKILFVILFIVLTVCVSAQNNTIYDNLSVENRNYYGYIYPHYNELNYFIRKHIYANELKFCKQTTGTKEWHVVYKYPTVGVGLNFINLQNKKQLGNSFSAFVFADIPWIRRRNFLFGYQYAFGISYLTKSFDTKNNYKSQALSTHFNAYLSYLLTASFRLSSHINCGMGGGIIHFSNGNWEIPNWGINNFLVYGSIKYRVSKTETPFTKRELNAYSKKLRYSVFANAGLREQYPEGGKKYFVSSVILNVDRQISFKRRLGVGLDLFYDASKEIEIRERSTYNPHSSDYLYSGVHLAYIILYGNFEIHANQGFYIWRKAKFYQTIYQRFALRYYCHNNLILNISLKTFILHADFIEWGVGYSF